MSGPPLVAIDVTGIVGEKKTLTGIQRVIFELVPRLCRRFWARGAGVELVHSREGSVKQVWNEAVSDDEIISALTRFAHLNGGWIDPTVDELNAMLADAKGPAWAILKIKQQLRYNPQFRQFLNNSRRFRETAQFVERALLHRGGGGGKGGGEWSEPRRCNYLISLSGGLMPLNIPSWLDPQNVLVVVHDLIPLTHPQLAFEDVLKRFQKESCALAHRPGLRYVTPSRTVARDLRRFLTAHGQPDCDVHAVYWGYDRNTFVPTPDPTWRQRLGLPDDAFTVLSVSTISDARKRFTDVAEAVRLAAQRAPIYGVFVGHRDGGTPLSTKQVRYLGYVSDDDLRRAYSSTDLYVNWSAVEGFGLPVIEALACGAPVMLPPDCETLLEIAGSHARVPASASPEALAKAILQVYEDQARARPTPPDLSRFDWEAAADSMVDILANEVPAPKMMIANAIARSRR